MFYNANFIPVETIGYFVRAAAHGNTDSVPLYTIQSLLLLLAPILFAASIYMILGRLILACNATNYSPIRVNWLTKIFVFSDVFCFLIQGAGGGLLAAAKSKADFDRDNNIVLGGLVLQIVVFCGFVVSAGVWHKRMKTKPTVEAAEVNWEAMLWALYISSVLVTGRNLYRVIEYGMGQTGYLIRHEWALYVFDAFFMTVVLAIGVWWYGIGLRSKGRRSAGRREDHAIMLESGGSAEELTRRKGGA